MSRTVRTLQPDLGTWASNPDRACAGVDPELFYPASYHTPAAELTKQMCRRCPVRDDCLEHAVRTNEDGIWGGATPEGRRRIRLERTAVAAGGQ